MAKTTDSGEPWACRNCANMKIPDDFIHCPRCGSWRPGYEPKRENADAPI